MTQKQLTNFLGLTKTYSPDNINRGKTRSVALSAFSTSLVISTLIHICFAVSNIDTILLIAGLVGVLVGVSFYLDYSRIGRLLRQ